MPIFKRKPYWSWGRLLHLVEGLAGVALGGLLWGDLGAVVATVVVTTIGAGWEILNRKWPPGTWMFGDLLDFVFFVLGALIADIGYWILTGGS